MQPQQEVLSLGHLFTLPKTVFDIVSHPGGSWEQLHREEPFWRLDIS